MGYSECWHANNLREANAGRGGTCLVSASPPKVGFRGIYTPIIENQMEMNMKFDMETKIL